MTQQIQEQELIDRTIEIVSEIISNRLERTSEAMMPDEEKSEVEKNVEKHTNEAKRILKSKTFKSTFCAGMKSLFSNSNSITRATVPALVTLSKTGFLTKPIAPFLAAALVLILVEAGVASYCHDLKD